MGEPSRPLPSSRPSPRPMGDLLRGILPPGKSGLRERALLGDIPPPGPSFRSGLRPRFLALDPEKDKNDDLKAVKLNIRGVTRQTKATKTKMEKSTKIVSRCSRVVLDAKKATGDCDEGVRDAHRGLSKSHTSISYVLG